MSSGIETLAIIKSGAIKNISNSIIKSTKDYLFKTLKKKLKTDKTDFENCLGEHLQTIINWSSEINFEGLQKTKSLTQTYIDLDILLTPKKYQYHENESTKKIKLKELFEGFSQNVILLGQPGAGKTTSVKKICNEILFPTKFTNAKFDYVLLIRVSELSLHNDYSIFRKIFSIFNIEIENFNNNYEIIEKAVLKVLNEKPALIVIDGLDEIYSIKAKHALFGELNILSLGLTNSAFIATIRSGDYDTNIERTKVFEICPLTSKQVIEFSNKWFDTPYESHDFIRELKNKSYTDLLERPIFISLLCSIFERAGTLPEKPKSIYRRAVYILLEEWNTQWRIKRETKYSQLDSDLKFDFLSNLAYYLTVDNHTLFFNRDQLKKFYRSVNLKFNLPPNEAFQVINELESHHGIFIQDGYDAFCFYHKSMQEYLAAQYIKGFPSIPEDNHLLLSIPNELAICIALSTRGTEYFIELIFKRLRKEINIGFIGPFLSRLQLEKPTFEVNPLLALAFIYLNTLILNTKNNRIISLQPIKSFLNSNEFKQSLKELSKTSKTFRLLTSTKKINVYNYNGENEFEFLYHEQLKLETKYCLKL